MENCFVVSYDIKERNKLYLFLKLLGYKWANGEAIENQEHCFQLVRIPCHRPPYRSAGRFEL